MNPLLQLLHMVLTRELIAQENGIFFVFDLGGGTFDVSLITIKDKVFQVKATAVISFVLPMVFSF
jgi:molecular chaperone DnaK (HSP70)